MINNSENILAFIKYEGELVKDGYLDARKSGEVLIGIDETIKYFIYQEYPEIKGYDFELPIRIRKGSWESIFPENIESFAVTAFGTWMAGKYFGSALEEIAKNDFKDVSFKRIFKESFKKMIDVIKLAKHLGTLIKKKIDNVSFSENNTLINVFNDNGEKITVSPEIIESYNNCPANVFNKITKIIEEERLLSLGINDNGQFIEEKITYTHKYIFSKTEDEEEIILPELIHGSYIELQGHITRGNEKSNTIGFLYQGHILTCYPDSGNVKYQKRNMFNNCIMKGFVERLDRDGNIKEKRPRIRFLEVINLEIQPPSNLFS